MPNKSTDPMRLANVIRRCPQCGRVQRPLIARLYSSGFIETMKCKHCDAIAPYDDWHVWNHGQSKYGSKEAAEAAWQARNRQWAIEHPERIRESKRRYAQSDKGMVTKRRYRDSHREEKREADRRYLERHHDEISERRREWRESNRQWIKTLNFRYYQAMQRDKNDHRHGTYYGYCLGCRCEKCVQAGAEYRRKARAS